MNHDDKFDGVRELIRARMVEFAVPSLAVAVAKDGQIIWKEGFGWADRERRKPATAHTMYSLASISKPITATGLMILKEKGLLELDAPMNNYLGDAKLKSWLGNPDDATVRRVANHSSGLPLHYHFFCEDENYPRPSMDETIRRYGNLVTLPGERYQYSNLGYGILDYVISRLSGKSYADYMRQEVLLPLGMTRASVHVGQGLEKYQAIRYGFDGKPIPFYDFDHPGGSAVYCSAYDLVRFGMFHLREHLSDQKAILSDQTIYEMQQPTMPIGNNSGYGIGWRMAENDMGYRSVSHTGGMGGVSTTLTLIPEERMAVVALTNCSNSLPHDICREIFSVMLPKYAENRAILEAKQKEESAKKQEERKFSPLPELMGEWNGKVITYKEEIPVAFWFKEDGDIQVKVGNQLKTLLNDVNFEDGYLSGRMMGSMGTEDANRKLHNLHVALKLRDDVLNGTMIAISLPGQKMGNALSHWMEIRKHS